MEITELSALNLKADRLHPRHYPYMPLITDTQLREWGQTDATKCIISLLS